ncbi:MAG: UbiD family decarboxylase [Dehalococcoidia bacterium]|nr:UbiD family decarboxylase [Dehalococcoidia bacterium]
MSDDLRAWLKKVEAMGELKVVEGADWDLELGCRTALDWNNWRNAPALLFDNIKGYPGGHRVLTNFVMAPNRVALTVGLPQGLSDRGRMDALRDRIDVWHSKMGDFPPVTVKTGPVMENVVSGKDVDVFKFPAPKWQELDGGRYIGTGHAVITRDLDTGEVNLGCYRVQAYDEKTVGIYSERGKHGWLDMQKYHERGLPCPVAISLGHHPLFFLIAALALKRSEKEKAHEYQFIGAIRGEPVEVIEEEITGLPIPADSEIVLVGWSPPGKTRMEGPFGEFTGYYASGEVQRPVIEIERIYYRNKPILTGAPPSRPPHGWFYFVTLMKSVTLEHQLREIGIPDVRGLWLHESPGNLFVTVSIKQRYAGHARQTALAALDLAARAGIGGRYVIVTDEDVDVTNISDILWALTTRSDPERSIDIIRDYRSASLDPIIRKPAASFSGSCAIINACKPYEWMNEFPRAIAFSPEVVKRVKEKYGLK